MSEGWVAIILACIAVLGTGVNGYFAYRAAVASRATTTQVATSNGHTLGQQVDEIRDDVKLIRIWHIEHVRDHAFKRER